MNKKHILIGILLIVIICMIFLFSTLLNTSSSVMGIDTNITPIISTTESAVQADAISTTNSTIKIEDTPVLKNKIEKEVVVVAPYNTTTVVNGKDAIINTYLFQQRSYSKIRDIAAELVDTFDISWNLELNTVQVMVGNRYTPVGGENGTLTVKESTQAIHTSTSVILNNTEHILETCIIYGEPYYKLRDLAQILPIEVDWDGRILINTKDTTSKKD